MRRQTIITKRMSEPFIVLQKHRQLDDNCCSLTQNERERERVKADICLLGIDGLNNERDILKRYLK